MYACGWWRWRWRDARRRSRCKVNDEARQSKEKTPAIPAGRESPNAGAVTSATALDSGNRGGSREHRGQIAILDEVMFGEPAIVEAVILGPYNLVENFAIEAIVRLAPLRRIAEVVPEAETDFFAVAHGISP